MATNERLTYNVNEAAEVLGISRNSVYQACLTGEIECWRIGKRILISKAYVAKRLGLNGEVKNGEQCIDT